MLNFFANLRLSIKIFLPVAILMLVAVFIVYDAMNGFSKINAQSDSLVIDAKRLANSLEIESNVNNATVAEKNMLLSTNPANRPAYREEFENSIKASLTAIDGNIGLSDTDERRQGNELVKQHILQFAEVSRRSMDLVVAGDMQGADFISRGEARKLRQVISKDVDERVQRNQKAAEQGSRDIDDIIKTTNNEVLTISAIGLSSGIILLYLMVQFMVVRPIAATTDAMKSVADGNLETEVKGAERKDEVGRLAQALLVFKENALETRRLTTEQERMKAQAAAEQRAALNKMADEFEQSVGGVVTLVASSATEMQHSAQSLSASAEETSQQAAAVSAATTQTSSNVQIVAASAEELSASINEISQQVQQSNKATMDAVEQVRKTTTTMSELSEVAQNIGHVVDLIRDIADQTNLLALNATIEAARAGDAGKGFAVVAGEVKALASQTSSATNEIAKRISDIQNAAQEATRAIDLIGTSIDNVNQISGVIASAVVEQQAATNEIAGNVQQASAGVDEVSANMSGVTQASGEVGSASTQLLGASQELAVQADKLREEVSQFLDTVRAA